MSHLPFEMETASEKQRRASTYASVSVEDRPRRTSQFTNLSASEKQRRASNFSKSSTQDRNRRSSQFVDLNTPNRSRRASQFSNFSPQETTQRRESKYTAVDADNEAGPKKSRRGLWVAIAAAVLLVVIALGVGLGVGLTRNNEDSESDSPSTSTTTATTPPGTASSTPPGSTSIAYNAADAISSTVWQPAVGTKWQIEILTALTNSSINAGVYDIDLFTNTAETISSLHAAGRKVICYFSAGSYEDFRPDSSSFKPSDYGKGLNGWPGEYWLNTSSTNVREIMVARLNLAVSKGCDGVDPDNVDGFDNDTGLDLTEDTAVEYMTFLASGAHSRNMSIGLKNSGDIVNRTLSMMQWQINEQCEEFDECTSFQPFIRANKPVFHIEYDASTPNPTATVIREICQNGTSINGFSTVIKNMKLNSWLHQCP